MLFRGLGVLPPINVTMADFASVMQTAVLDRPVVDRTRLSGRLDFTLTWTPDESQFRGMSVRVPPPTDDPNAPPNLFTAVQEQLGLRFESTNAPVEVPVIDRVERPSEN
ncbi:MAG: TIGR03435 family protein [Acidimicrobiia bacterium]|nr:TIGR03435 family protein [Acidimicrobiia bacterium]